MEFMKGLNLACGVLLLLGVAVWLSAMAAGGINEAVVDRVFERLQESRLAAGATALERRTELDAIARERAVEVAGLPHASRLKAVEPIGEAIQRAGITRYLRYSLHQDMSRGYTDPAAAFLENWRKYDQPWLNAMDSEFDGIGLASAIGADRWRILVVVLLSDLIIESEVSLEAQAVRAINDIRGQHQLVPLALDPSLADVARGHSRDMADHDYFAHESPAGDTVGGRMARAGLSYAVVAENLQMSRGIQDPVQVAAEEWMKSPPHRANILNPDFTHTAVGVAVTAAGAVYFTQVFLTPQALPDP